MELAQLRYFLKIVEHRNFTRAAKACDVSQPALSQQIAKLEKELGMPLFERQGRKVRLTQTGKVLRASAEKILSLVQDTHRQINDDGHSGVVTISTSPTVGPFLTTKLIHNIGRQFPEAELRLLESSVENLLLNPNNEVEFAITEMEPAWKKNFVFQPILREEIQVVMSVNHPLAGKPVINIEDLRELSFVLLAKRYLLCKKVDAFFDEFCISPNIVARVEQFSTLQHLVAIGKGMGFIPKMAVNPKFKTNLAYKSIDGANLEREIGICWNSDRYQSQLGENMIKAIRELADPSLLGQAKSNSVPVKVTK